MVRLSTEPGRPRKRGAALITALVFTLIFALLVGGGLAYVVQNLRLAAARRDSEAALLLAESGINNEFNYITKNLYDPVVTKRSTQPIQIGGEPYIGRKGTLPGIPGEFWVFTSVSPEAPYQGWTGGNTLYVICNARVNGAWKRVRVGGENVLGTLFNLFALFGLDTGNDNNSPSIALTGNANVEVVGTVGTNGHIQKGQGVITYLKAINYNGSYYEGTPKEQFKDPPVYTNNDRLNFPVVVQVLRALFPATSNMSDSATWAWVKTNRQNSSRILQWKPALPSGTVLNPANVVSAGYPSDDVTLVNKKLGSWEKANFKPGSSTVRTLIFPPGDYYFESIDLLDDPATELVIDNAGLSVGGNPNKEQVRFFLYGSGGKDTVEIPINLTQPNDAKTFRIYDGKDGSVFELLRSSHTTGEYTLAGCIYAATAQVGKGYLKGIQIRLVGGDGPTSRSVLLGSLMADRIEFQKYCRIIFPDDSGNNNDPPVSVGFVGGYWEY